MKKRTIVLLSLLLVLVLGWVVLSMTVLNDEWLKERLVHEVRQALDAELDIETASFQPWQGHAELEGISFRRTRDNSDATVVADAVEVDVAILPLLVRRINVKRLKIVKPRMTIEVDREAEPEVKESLQRLQEAVAQAISELIVSFLEAILEPFVGKPGYTIEIDELIVHDGQIDVTVRREGVEPFVARLKGIEYLKRNVKPAVSLDYLRRADYRATIEIGATSTTVANQHYTDPQNLTITGLDLGQIDRLLKQKDALEIKGGTLDLECVDDGSNTRFKAELTDLELARNPNAPVADFSFIPVDWLISYVNKQDGNLSLEYDIDLDNDQGASSEDFRRIVKQSWEGMWSEMLKQHKDMGLENLKRKATNRLRNLLGSDDDEAVEDVAEEQPR